MSTNIYSDKVTKSFDAVFSKPDAIYRDTPFWAWNCRMEKSQLMRQIEVFQRMGMGGFHMHSRTGMGLPYLQKEFMDLVRDCVEEAKRRDMLAWLYDEDRWPSGSAGGIVTKDPKYSARHLEVSFQPVEDKADAERDNSGELIACYLVRLDDDCRLSEYRRCAADEAAPEGFQKIWCRKVLQAKSSWFNDQTYVDTLNPKAIQRFVDVTYEAYFKAVGKDFAKAVPSIFTDEPQFTMKDCLTFANQSRTLNLPYTDDLPETYRAAYGSELLDTLPEVIWELPDGKYSLARYRFHDHIAERFASAFADTIGGWCRSHGIVNTGHMMEEPTLASQTRCLGEAMRSYRSFLLPGIDMLCDLQEFSTAKQAQSASRQFDRGGVLSELDGVTDWDFNFMGHKAHGDWQAALGVTVRVPHLSWVSMAGEAKRDYPASISYQSPWCDKYHLIADHFARVGAAMTRGKALVNVAVLHPIESFWLLWGPQDQTANARQQAEDNFSSLFDWMLKGLVDFDLVCESLLPGQNPHVEGKELCIGNMRYRTIVVTPSLTMRSTTLKVLEEFRAAGGDVLFAGDPPELCDALPSRRAVELAKRCRRCAYSKATLLSALEDCREVRAVNALSGMALDKLLYQLREDADGTRYFFLCNTERQGQVNPARIMFRGGWQLELLDTMTGVITPLKADVEGGWTVLKTDIYAHGHLLLRMVRASSSFGKPMPRLPIVEMDVERGIVSRVNGDEVPVTLDEPNPLLLDQAQWRIDGGDWQPTEEILRLDNLARAKFGMRPVTGEIVEPWVYPPSDKVYGTLELRYEFECECATSGAMLALEQPDDTQIILDGNEIRYQDEGYWTDECVRKTILPPLAVGKHVLQLSRKYTDRTQIERIYILGDFGVKVAGRKATITAPVRTLHWGDVTVQGLPFYGGNIIYHTVFRLVEGGEMALRLPSRQSSYHRHLAAGGQAARELEFVGFRGTLVSAKLDGKEMGDIAFAPFVLPLGNVAAGEHQLELTLYGNRYNAFGSVHLSGRVFWAGPSAFRTSGNLFTYGYATMPLGITREPLVVRK